MVKPQTILLVDDHSLITTAMSALLQSMYPDVQIHVGATAKEAVELAEKYGDSADLMILDLGLPDSQGTDLLVRLLQNYPALKILVLSGNCDPDSILKALSAGAAGYVPKTLDANLLKSTINFVLEGGVYIPSKILSQQQSMGMSPQQPVGQSLFKGSPDYSSVSGIEAFEPGRFHQDDLPQDGSFRGYD